MMAHQYSYRMWLTAAVLGAIPWKQASWEASRRYPIALLMIISESMSTRTIDWKHNRLPCAQCCCRPYSYMTNQLHSYVIVFSMPNPLHIAVDVVCKCTACSTSLLRATSTSCPSIFPSWPTRWYMFEAASSSTLIKEYSQQSSPH
jgi:hypothetical protein